MSPIDEDDTVLSARNGSTTNPDESTQISKRTRSKAVGEIITAKDLADPDDSEEDQTVLVSRSPRNIETYDATEQSTILVRSSNSTKNMDDSHKANVSDDDSDDSTRISTRYSPLDQEEESTTLSSRNADNSKVDDKTKISSRSIDSTQQSSRNQNTAKLQKPEDSNQVLPKNFFKEPEVKSGSKQEFSRGSKELSSSPLREDFSWSDDERVLLLSTLKDQQKLTARRKRKRGTILLSAVVFSVIAMGAALALLLFVI